MTVANATFASLHDIARHTDCVGVEIRNDLGRAMFDGEVANAAGKGLRETGLRILAIAEVSAFNDLSERAFASVQQLAALASAAGAEAVSLIPRNNGLGGDAKTRKACLRDTLIKFAPVFEQTRVQGYIEPLGFEQSSLRYKSEVVEVLESCGLTPLYKMVHDTFHHHLAGGGDIYPQHTGMVHVSGVVTETIETHEMRDEHRVLVDKKDRLKNLAQLTALISGGYRGPISIEAFSPQVHGLTDPEAALSECFTYIESNLANA